MRKAFPGLFLILNIYFTIGCKESDEYHYPIIQTGEVTDITDTGAIFHAKIFSTGETGISEYGFVWGRQENPGIDNSKMLISQSRGTGVIKESVSYDLYPDTLYYVKAFARNDAFLTYGKEVTFRSKGSLPPVIYDFNPKEGSAGTKVTITGKNFSSSLNGNIVEIGRFRAVIEEASSEMLVVVLPDNLTTSGMVRIIMKTANHRIESDQLFTLTGCSITGFSPHTLIGGDYLYVKAQGLSPAISENIVKIGSVAAEVSEINEDTLAVLVPYNSVIGLNEVSLTVNDRTFYSEDSLQVRSPWSSNEGSFSICRTGQINFSVGMNGYSGLGVTSSMFYEAHNDLWKYNFETRVWTQCADMPDTAREDAASFVIGNKGYIGLGNYGGIWFFRDLYEYDPDEDKWTKKSDFPGKLQLEMFYIVIDNKAYFGFGDFWNEGPHYFWEYDPATDKWTQRSDYPSDMGTFGAAGFEYNKMGYLVFGNNIYNSNRKPLRRYDPITDTWTRLSDFPGNYRSSAVRFSLGNSGYLGLGYSSQPLTDFWRYDFKDDKWIRIADLPYFGRYGAACFTSGGIGYLWSGSDCDFDDSVVLFNPESLP